MNRINTIIKGLLVLLVGLFLLWEGFKWTVMRTYVDEEHALLVMNKFGDPLPPDMIVVPKDQNHFKGIHEEVLGPGRYFINPIEYHVEEVPLVQISAGQPDKWDWDTEGRLKDPQSCPMVGLVTLKQGKNPPPGEEVVGPEYRGIQAQVLTPGTYKINPKLMEVTLVPAVIVPPGSVGVVTRLVEGEAMRGIPVASAPLVHAIQPASDSDSARIRVGATHRGILRDVLQPGIYYLNPRMAKITIMPVGYDEITLEHNGNTAISFYSQDGYQVQADFTVVWGRAPADAPEIVATIGTTQRIEQNVIAPAMKAACQNEGSKYTAVELIQGQSRSKFQDDLSQALEAQVHPRHVSILLALIRDIAIKDKSGKDATNGLLATIQRANIEVERNLTNQQKTATAAKQAELEQANKLVDVAQQTVAAETGVKVANISADGQKQAAEIGAQRDLSIATINLQVSQFEAQRTQILGKAQADVERMKNEAEAKGAKLLVDALGSPQAYNQYIFAKNFQPTDLRLIFAGQGTFWTDLKSFQEVGAVKMLQPADAAAPGAEIRSSKSETRSKSE
jgi:regulator of protease activity HflC (stomatin/prohibitin superfamily)